MFRAGKLSLPLVAALAAALWAGGCAARPAGSRSGSAARPGAAPTSLGMAPISLAAGRVASVNASARFVVVSFPVGQVPPNDTRFAIFHAGQKVGALKISGPAQDTFTVGDITAGSAQEGDEVRAE